VVRPAVKTAMTPAINPGAPRRGLVPLWPLPTACLRRSYARSSPLSHECSSLTTRRSAAGGQGPGRFRACVVLGG
jgi:hypothetical protein